MDENRYVVCACKNVHDFKLAGKFRPMYTKERWYQHSKHRNKQYHFCTALSDKNYLYMGDLIRSMQRGYRMMMMTLL